MDEDLGNRFAFLTQTRLFVLLPIVIFVVVGLIYVAFFGTSILPSIRNWRNVTARLDAADAALTQALKTKEETPETLSLQVRNVQIAFGESAAFFLAESQAADALSRLYEYAGAAGVEIVHVQNQISTDETQDVYYLRLFRLEVAGTVPGLLDYVSRIEEISYQSYSISNINIVEKEGLHTLTMDVKVYVSDSSGGASVSADEAPVPTPDVNISKDVAQLVEELDAAWIVEDWERAIMLINQIRALSSSEEMNEKLYAAHVNYGYRSLTVGDKTVSAERFRLALVVKPDGQEAQDGFRQAAATPTPTPTYEQLLIVQLDVVWSAGDWEQVLRLLDEIAVKNPGAVDVEEKRYAAYVNLGYTRYAAGRLVEAKEAFGLALEINPEGEEALAGLQALSERSAPTTPVPRPEYVTHVVQRGETLYSISRRYGTTVAAIQAANGLTDTKIRVGQELRIPTGP